MNARTPTIAAIVIAVAGGGVYFIKKARAEKELNGLHGRRTDLQGRLQDLETMKADTARIRSETGTREALEAERRALLARSLGRKEVAPVVERLGAVAKKYALGTFDAARAVRTTEAPCSPRLVKLDIQVEVATDWPRLGAILGEVRALAPRVALAEATVRRAEDVPILGVRLILVAYVATEGGAPDAAPAAEDRFEGASPFFLQSELDEQRSRRLPAPPLPPVRIELAGVIYAKGASHVIVNDEPVAEGKTFKSGTETVKVLDVSPDRARFQVGERILERELAPLSRGGGK